MQKNGNLEGQMCFPGFSVLAQSARPCYLSVHGGENMRRCFAMVLLLAVMACSCAHAGTFFEQYLLDVATIIQRSPRYTASMYQYKKKDFSVRGCGPSSVVNALCAASSVEEQNIADLLLRETMRILTYNYEPATAGIDIKYIGRMQDPDPSKFPHLSMLKTQYGAWQVTDETLSPEKVLEFAQKVKESEKPGFLMGMYTVRSHWEELAQLLRTMAADGMEDAIVSIAFLGCGSSGTGAPFRLSDGHYASLCFQCGAFAENTSLYLLDSNPRALPEEPLVYGKYYERYFMDMAGEMLTDTFDVFRVSQGIVGFRLNAEHRAAIEAVRQETDEDEARAEEGGMLEKLLMYGNGLMMIMIP